MKLLWISAAVAAGLVAVASVLPGPYAGAVRVDPASAAAPLAQASQLGPDATATLARACSNCHSDRTEWPLYGQIAPVSWLLRRDVAEGRKFFNLSRWPEYGAAGQGQLLSAASGQIKAGQMPPARYLLLHPEARLTDQEKAALIVALERESSRLLNPTQSTNNSKEDKP